MSNSKKEYKSLAQYIISKRELLDLSQEDLAQKSNLSLDEIRSIEGGFELFLSTTARQKLAKGLKVENKEIKQYEKKVDFSPVSNSTMDEIREAIIVNAANPNFSINCPVCAEKLKTRIAKLYDLEGNLILRAKANCTKCPFQLID